MAYAMCYGLNLGSANAGLADLRAQLRSAGADVGAAISTGFTDEGNGCYEWQYASFPDSFRGSVKFYSNAAPATTLGIVGANPEDGENIDAKTTSRSSHSAADVVTALGTGSTLTAIPWNAVWDAEVQSECTDALNAYDPPTNAEMEARTLASASYALEATLTAIKGATWSAATDTLEAIRDRGDIAWITATGFSTLSQADVRTAVGLASANLDTQLADLPTVAEFNARTLVAADYFVVGDYTTPPSAAAVASQVRTELTTEMGRIDVAVSTRSTYAGGAVASVTAAVTTTKDTVIDTIAVDVAGLDGAAMRGTDGAYTGTPPTASAISTQVASDLAAAHGAGSWATATGFSTHSAADVVTALGTGSTLTALATAVNLATIAGYLDTEIAAIKAKTDNLPASPAAVGSAMTLTGAYDAAKTAAQAGDAMALTASERNSTTDVVLGRSVATCEATAAEWSLCTIVLAALESQIVGTIWTIKRTDGITTHVEKTIATDPLAEPITQVS